MKRPKKKQRYHSCNAALVYKSPPGKATALMEHVQSFIHEHIHFRRQDVDVAIEVEELFQQQGKLPRKMQAVLSPIFTISIRMWFTSSSA